MTTNICVNFDSKYNKYEFWYRKYPPTVPYKLVAKPIKFEKAYEGTSSEPFLSFSHTEIQELIDQLWDLGIRPVKFPKRKK